MFTLQASHPGLSFPFFFLQLFKLLLCEGPFQKKIYSSVYEKKKGGKHALKTKVGTFIIFSIEELVKVVEDFASESWQNVDV